MFTVFDSKGDVYSSPFYALTDQAAVRTFADAVNTPDSPYNKHPEDYAVYAIGDFDDRTGILTSHPIMQLGQASNLRSEEPTPIRATS